jgi:hypothetical protein
MQLHGVVTQLHGLVMVMQLHARPLGGAEADPHWGTRAAPASLKARIMLQTR